MSLNTTRKILEIINVTDFNFLRAIIKHKLPFIIDYVKI